MIYGYARVSTSEQSTDLQLQAFKKNDITTVHQEHQSSIKIRPVLEHLLANILKPGDVLAVYKLDRLARSMSHFLKIFDALKDKGIGFRSLTEQIDTTTPQGRMFLNLLAVFAEYERELIRERCMAGQKAARLNGKTWGRKRKLTDSEAKKITAMWRSGWYEQSTIADMFDMSTASVRDYIHKIEGRGRWKNATPTQKK